MSSLNAEKLARAKSLGFSDRQIAHLTGSTEDAVRAERKRIGLVPSYRLVDTCAAEFEAYTPYYYSTYDRSDDEVKGNTAKITGWEQGSGLKSADERAADGSHEP